MMFRQKSLKSLQALEKLVNNSMFRQKSLKSLQVLEKLVNNSN